MVRFLIIIIIFSSDKLYSQAGNDSILYQYNAIIQAENYLHVQKIERLDRILFRVQSLLGKKKIVFGYLKPNLFCDNREECSDCKRRLYSKFIIKHNNDQEPIVSLLLTNPEHPIDGYIGIEIKKEKDGLWYSRIRYWWINENIGLLPDFQENSNTQDINISIADFTKIDSAMRFDWVDDVFNIYIQKSYNDEYIVEKF